MYPAIAVAYSHSSICSPRVPETRMSPAAAAVVAGVSASVTSRTIWRSAGRALSSGASDSRTTGRMPVPSLPVDSAMSCSAQSANPTIGGPLATIPSLSRWGCESGGGVACIIQQCRNIHTREPGGNKPKSCQGRISTPHIRVSVEDTVARGARGDIERGTGIGDNNDAISRIDASVVKGLLVHPALAVGFDRGARLRRDDDGSFGKPVGERRANLTRFG